MSDEMSQVVSMCVNGVSSHVAWTNTQKYLQSRLVVVLPCQLGTNVLCSLEVISTKIRLISLFTHRVQFQSSMRSKLVDTVCRPNEVA